MSEKEERVDQPEEHVPQGDEPPVAPAPSEDMTPPAAPEGVDAAGADADMGEISPTEAAALQDEIAADGLPAEVDGVTRAASVDLTWADHAAQAALEAEAVDAALYVDEPSPKVRGAHAARLGPPGRDEPVLGARRRGRRVPDHLRRCCCCASGPI